MLKSTSQLLARSIRSTAPFRLVSSSQKQTISGESGDAVEPKQVSEFTDSKKEEKLDQLFKHLWIKCSGHGVEVLDSYESFLKMAANHLDIDYVRTEEPFRTIQRRTLLASRFVHKKYRVQYETRTYYRNLLFKNLTGSTADTYLEYIQRNLPEGVMLVTEKHRLAELPFDLQYEAEQDESRRTTYGKLY